jgi:CheY-like chemotaxis protein
MSDKGHILIVDDTQQNIQVLGTMLRAEDYQISVAMNGLQALERVEHIAPDLNLLDVMMPELDGIETCKRLKANDKTKDIPVIFLTALADYVTKPPSKAPSSCAG